MKENPATEEMEKYFAQIDEQARGCYEIAEKARKKGFEPEQEVDVKLAKNMAERVEGLISAVAPQLLGSGMTQRIMELEDKYSPLDWRVALVIAEEVAKEKFCKFNDKKEAIEVGIRVGFAYHTSGIVAAPLEGLVELKVKKRHDGGEYFAPCYAGPIRGAGGTAAAFSLVLVDYVRKKTGHGTWDATEDEIGRVKSEISDYHERVTNLQYFPSTDELDFLLRNIPVEISGDPTEKFEVSNHKDIERMGTNRIRGGVCLVLAEGLAQKAPKLWKRLGEWGEEFGLEWGWLKEFLELKKKIAAKAKGPSEKKDEKPRLTPNYTFIKDLVAGRPVLAFPMRPGGFRLRYGRCRISGFSAASIHPATMVLLNKFIVTGTQLKIERPGKAASVLPCDTIMPPVVKLKDGTVKEIKSVDEANEHKKEIDKILYLGDILFNYGDFSENGHSLVPCGYNEDWWAKEVLSKTSIKKLSEKTKIDEERLNSILKEPNKTKVTVDEAIVISKSSGAGLHPKYTYFWSLLKTEELSKLVNWLDEASIKKDGEKVTKLVFPYRDEEKEFLERIAVSHVLVNNEFVVIKNDDAKAFFYSLFGLKKAEEGKFSKEAEIIDLINEYSDVKIMNKAGTFVGARMGRPEKAKHRKMTGSPHTLFPVGEEGGRLRSIITALDKGYVMADFILRYCPKCKKNSIYYMCEECNEKTEQRYFCPKCDSIIKTAECSKHGPALTYKTQRIDLKYYFDKAKKRMQERMIPEMIKGVKGTSNKDHVPEHISKGIMRAKHNLFVNKDGTIRFDMTELPITHFRPAEIGTGVEKLKEMGYEKDCYGNTLNDDKQVVEIKPHDVILPASTDALDEQSDNVLFRAGKFVDDLLVKLYGVSPFYNFKKKSDLVGHLVVGLAPHTSAGTVGRIIGFTNTQGFLAHPLMHAAFRRDCDGDEAAVVMLMDALLNFSRQYLPNSRGAKTMDAPLVLSSRIIPTEVDDMVHGLDVVWDYPLEFYEAAQQFKMPWEIEVEQLKKRLNTPLQYEGMGFTHDVTSINMGINISAYKQLPSMEEKLHGQMDIAEKVMAVDEAKVAQFVIEKHFLKDTKGNLRKFSMQQFRCVKCNEKYRRPPLAGKCIKCGDRLIFTISEGSVIKYLQPSIQLSEKYNVSAYLKQTLQLLNQRIEEVFGKDKEKQEGLSKWFG
ncbi:MAG: DNA polymerase II large subunit [Candidatus Nanoarchaeia archaeon]